MNKLRADNFFLTECKSKKASKGNKLKRIKTKYTQPRDNIDNQIKIHKQKHQLKAKYLTRYKKQTAFCRHNKYFKDAKTLYRDLSKNNTPAYDSIEKFWKNICREPGRFNAELNWIGD